MVETRIVVVRQILCAITVFGFANCQFETCRPHVNVYLSDGNCIYMCPVQKVTDGYLLCKSDGHTAVPCEFEGIQDEECTELKCEVVRASPCHDSPSPIFREVRFIRSHLPTENVTLSPIYIHHDTKPNTRPTHGDLPRITFEEPTSQMYMYGILSFFFGVIAFFVFALLFRFLYKRYQRHPVHVHTFSGHQLPLGSLQLRSFLSPSPYPPQLPFPRSEQTGIPGLDLPPSYVVASELLDPPPSYEDISKPKRHSAQMKVTSL